MERSSTKPASGQDRLSRLLGAPNNLQVALDLAAQGIKTFPCNVKVPLVRWKEAATTDPKIIKGWWRKWPQAVPAIPTGERNGLAVLDLDRHESGKDGVAALGDTEAAFTVDTPNGGRHLYFQHRPGMGNGSAHLPEGCDVRAEGGFVMAPGAMLPDGRRYVATGSLDKLTPWPRHLAPPRNLLNLLGKPDTPQIDWDRERPRVKTALAKITDADSRDDWLTIGMALHHATGGSDEGFQLWGNWSEQSLKFDSKVQRQTWRGFGRNRATVTLASLYQIATGYGWRAATEISDDEFPDEADLPPIPTKPKPKARLTFLSPAECEAAQSRGYIIKGLLAPGDVGCIFGAPGAGKSLLAPYLGYMLARGEPAFGLRSKPGAVFYVAAEDPHGMRGRVKALRAAHGDAESFFLVEGLANLLSPDAPDMAALVDAAKARRPSLIVIDTLAMAFPGLEENSAEAMGRVVDVARKLAATGAAVLLVHHDTKAETGTPRGHSILNGALDVALHVKRDDQGTIRGKLKKNRNGTCERDIAFTIAIEDGGEDEDGDMVTLPRCKPVAWSDPLDVKLSGAERKLVQIYHRLSVLSELSDHPGEVPEMDLRGAATEQGALSDSDAKKSRQTAYRRAIDGLATKGLVTMSPDKTWIFLHVSGDQPAWRHEATSGDKGNMSPSESSDGVATDSDTPLKGCRLSLSPVDHQDSEEGSAE